MTKKGITSNRRDAFEARGAMRRFGVPEVGEEIGFQCGIGRVVPEIAELAGK